MNRIVATSAMSAAAGCPARSRMTVASSVPIGMSVAAGWRGCPSHLPLRRSRIGTIRRKSAFSHRWLKSPNGFAQTSWAATIRASRWDTAGYLPPGVYPQTVHTGDEFGDNFSRFRCKFVDKPVVARRGPPVIFVLPEGAGWTARPVGGVILRTVPGTRFAGRKAGERGTRRRSGTADLFVALEPVEQRSPPVPSGAFVCAARSGKPGRGHASLDTVATHPPWSDSRDLRVGRQPARHVPLASAQVPAPPA